MITPSHLIYSWALAKRTEMTTSSGPAKHHTRAFIIGALLPDIPVYIFFLVCGLILGYGHEKLWDDLYFHSDWSVVFTLSHSLLLWPLLALIAHHKKWLQTKWITISALFHVAIDLCVHTTDAYMHFWPLSHWRFVSPISYWDPASYGQHVGTFDAGVVLLLLLWLYTQYQNTIMRLIIISVTSLALLRLYFEIYNLYFYA